jgi:hypothetical protein
VKPSVLDEIVRFRQARGEGLAGKFMQRLLALTLIKAGYRVDEEHTVEGPDLLVDKFQIEVKTTTAEPFTIQDKDIQDIDEATKKGKIPALALLECSSFRGWTIVNAQGLTKGNFRRGDFALRRIPDLEKAVNDHFDAIVEAWMPRLKENANAAFDEMGKARRAARWRPWTWGNSGNPA